MAKKVRKNVLINRAYSEWLEETSEKTGKSQGEILNEALYNLRHTYTMRELRNEGNNEEA